MALVRDVDHAERAVNAALDLVDALRDFTAVGTTTNLAARLQSEAEPLVPCISRATFEEVGQRFTFKPGSPRRVKPKGLTV
jgi:class 3 adenylate cyclase